MDDTGDVDQFQLGEAAFIEVDLLLVPSVSTKYLSGLEQQVFVILELDDLLLIFNYASCQFIEWSELSFHFFLNSVQKIQWIYLVSF